MNRSGTQASPQAAFALRWHTSKTSKEPVNIPAGALFTITSGAYSDFSIQGVFRAAKDIPTAELLAGYLREHADEGQPYNFDDRRFLAWVARQGYLEPIHSYEWHLGDYGDAGRVYLSGPEYHDPAEHHSPS